MRPGRHPKACSSQSEGAPRVIWSPGNLHREVEAAPDRLGFTAAHQALPRHHLCFLPGADPARQGLALRGQSAHHPEAHVGASRATSIVECIVVQGGWRFDTHSSIDGYGESSDSRGAQHPSTLAAHAGSQGNGRCRPGAPQSGKASGLQFEPLRKYRGSNMPESAR